MLSVTACVSFTYRHADVYAQLQQGNPRLALQYLEENGSFKRDRVLYELDKAMLLHLLGEYAPSNQLFESAKTKMQALSATSITENLAAVTVNEMGRSYVGQPYEQLLLYAYKTLNYLAMDEIDDARVEVLQADAKLREWNADEEWQGIDASVFMRYLSGIVFELTREKSEALIAYRQAYEVLLKNSRQIPKTLQQDLLRLTQYLGMNDEYRQYCETFPAAVTQETNRNHAEVILIFHQGLISRQYAQIISNFNPDLHQHVQIAVPAYPPATPFIIHAQLRIAGQVRDTELLQNVDQLARTNLAARMPGIMARAMVRVVTKKAMAKNAADENALAGFLVDLSGLLTEQADTRSWTALPASIQVTRISVPAGEYQVQVTSANHGVLVERMITLVPEQKIVISVHDVVDRYLMERSEQ